MSPEVTKADIGVTGGNPDKARIRHFVRECPRLTSIAGGTGARTAHPNSGFRLIVCRFPLAGHSQNANFSYCKVKADRELWVTRRTPSSEGGSPMSISRANRRDFIAALGGAVAWPAVARAQDRIRRIAILMNFTSGDMVEESRLSALLDALRSLGWTEGRNARIETRWGEGNIERVRKNAAELVAFSPDVILATTTPAVTLYDRRRCDTK
jgi:hypothetical protein